MYNNGDGVFLWVEKTENSILQMVKGLGEISLNECIIRILQS